MEQSLIIFSNRDIGIIDALNALSESGLTVKQDEPQRLSVQWEGGPVLYVRLDQNEEAEELIWQISDQSEYEISLKKCNSVFSISFDDFDAIIDEINTLIQTQITLQSITTGYLYNTWNKNISTP